MNTPKTQSEHSEKSQPNAEVLADAYRYILTCGEKRREREREVL